MAKPRPDRVVLDPTATGTMPAVSRTSHAGRRAYTEDVPDSRISTGELRALVDGDSTGTFAALGPTTPPPPPRPSVPTPRRAAQVDATVAGLLASMGIDPEKVTPDVLDGLGIGDLSTAELTAFLTQPSKPAPLSPSPSMRELPPTSGDFGMAPRPEFKPEPKIRPLTTDGSAARALPAATPEPTYEPAVDESGEHFFDDGGSAFEAPEPTFTAPEPQTAPTPKPLRMANTFAPMTGNFPAVRRPQTPPTPASLALPPVTPPPPPAPALSSGLIAGADTPIPAPADFDHGYAAAELPSVTTGAHEFDFDSGSIEIPGQGHEFEADAYPSEDYHEAAYATGDVYTDAVAHEGPATGSFVALTGSYDAVSTGSYDFNESYFRADTGSIEMPSLSEAATYRQDLDDRPALEVVPAVETTGTMVGIGDPMRRTTRRAAAAAASGRPTLPMTAGAAAILAAIGGIAMTAGPATNLAADDTRLVGATALGGESAMTTVGERGTTVTRDSDRDAAASAASTRDKALAGVDVQADKQDKFLKSNLWQLPIPLGAYHITGTFGSAGVHWATVHTGLDFAAPTGTPIHAVARGTVTSTAWGGAYGNRTIITLADGTELWYCHQSSRAVAVGDVISPGQVIGYVGATGNVTGPHLHLEVRPGGGDPVDPDDALAEHGADPTP